MYQKRFGLIGLGLGLTLALAPAAWAQNTNASAQNAPDQGQFAPPVQPQVPQPENGGVNWEGVGVGAGTVLGNVVYVPVKVVYGILGGIAGGAGYLLTGGNTQTANSIWRSSLGGDYVLTPDMIRGKQPIHFSGPSTATPITNQSSANDAGSNTANLAANGNNNPKPSGSSSGTSTPIDRGSGPVPQTGGSTPNNAPLPSTSIQ